MPKYIHQLEQWPNFTWNNKVIVSLLASVRNKQGRLNGYMELLGFDLRNQP